MLQTLHRSWHLLESFAASFVALNFIGGVRYACLHVHLLCFLTSCRRAGIFLGLLAGGPAAIWSVVAVFANCELHYLMPLLKVFIHRFDDIYVHHRRGFG